MKNKRRKFLKKASLASIGLLTVNETLHGSPNKLSAKSYSKVIGANDRINIAFQGLGRRLPGLLKSSVKLNNVDILYFCDVMKKQMIRANKQFNDLTGLSAKSEVDIHKILDDKNVDAVIMATPDHWHAYGACKAMESGKHVYLEKPCSHNMQESDQIVNHMRFFNKVVQMGNQQRSSNHTNNIIKKIHDGLIGDAYNAVAFYNNNRGMVPNQVEMKAPEGLNWNLFQGPAPRRKYTHDTWDYNWRWYGWEYGTGEAGNNATHELDIARWALNVNYPNNVSVFAQKNHFINDGWTMYDNMEAKFRFSENKSINWKGRSRNAFGKSRFGGRGTVIYGTKGSVFVNRKEYIVYDLKGNIVENVKSNDIESGISLGGGGDMTTRHMQNFIDAIRNNTQLNSPIEDAVISQSMVHYANIAYRANIAFDIDEISGKTTNKKANLFWSRNYESGWEIKMK
jgi:predicted dehydrogenase